SYFRRSEEFGITRDNWKINIAAVRERKRRMVAGLVDVHMDNYKKSGAELVMGSGRFIGPKNIEVTSSNRSLIWEELTIQIGQGAVMLSRDYATFGTWL